MRIDSIGTSTNTQTVNNESNSSQTNAVEETVSVESSVSVNQTDTLKAEELINEEILEKSVEQANKTLKNYNKVIEREVHEVTKTMLYRLKDTTTGEVIREFPPKKIQDMIAKMWELAGLFVDEKA